MKKMNPEVKGILGIFGALAVIAIFLAAGNGKFEQWFGWTFLSGPKIYDSIIYSKTENGSDKVVVANIIDGNQKTIFRGKDINDVAISPNGNKIAYISNLNDVDQVFTMNANGKKNKTITVTDTSKQKVQFSPNGQNISYISKGRVFKCDINGNNPKAIIPTRQQLQQLVSDRGEQLICKDYAWSNVSDGMLAVVSRGENADRFVLMLDGNDAHEIPLPTDFKMTVIGLTAAYEQDVYVASAKVNDFYIIFALTVPKEHSHNELSNNPEDYGLSPVYQSKEEISVPVIAPDGKTLIFSVKGKEKGKAFAGILSFNIEDKKIAPVYSGFYENIVFPKFGEGMVLKSGSTISYFDIPSSKKTVLSENINSFAISNKRPKK